MDYEVPETLKKHKGPSGYGYMVQIGGSPTLMNIRTPEGTYQKCEVLGCNHGYSD